MKKTLAILMAAALLLGFAACNLGGSRGPEFPEQAAGILLADSSQGDPTHVPSEYPWIYPGEMSAENIAMGLSELTGLRFDVSAELTNGANSIAVDWNLGSSLFTGPPEQQIDMFRFFDYDSLAWFMLDSLYRTILRNMPEIEAVYYTMGGGSELVLQNLSPPMGFTLDTPYMGSAFYFAHMGNRGDEPIDTADAQG